MARFRNLKVYRTSAGFHDAYVAAPSQKAALEAWGVDRNLFGLGLAEIVTDAALAREPLSKPGEVIKRPRGTEAEQIAALSAGDRPRGSSRKQRAAPRRKRAPRPSRSNLDAVEAALEQARARHKIATGKLAEQEAELERRKRALQQDQASEIEQLEREHDRARSAHAAALEKWRGQM
jgi:hypothetical protein